jgi:hypothetical protein
LWAVSWRFLGQGARYYQWFTEPTGPLRSMARSFGYRFWEYLMTRAPGVGIQRVHRWIEVKRQASTAMFQMGLHIEFKKNC